MTAGEPRAGPPSAGRTPRPLEGAGRLAAALLAQQPRRAALAVALLLVSAITEMFGLALIIPALHVAGMGGGDGAAGPVADAVRGGAAALGVELTWPTLLAAFVLLAALRSAVAWRREMHVAAMRHEFVDRLRERLYAATAEAAWPALVRRRQSDLLHALTHDVNQAGQGALSLIQGSVATMMVLAQVALAVVISAPVTAGMVLAGGVLLVAARPLVRRARTIGDRMTVAGRALHAVVAELLGGLKLAKSEGAEARHVRDFGAALADVRRAQLAYVRANAAAGALMTVGAAAALAGLVWLALRGAGLGPAELLVLALIGVRVLPAAQRLQKIGQQVAHVLPAWLHALAMERELRAAAEPPADPAAEPLPLRRALAVRGVSFRYGDPPAGRPALAGIDLVIPAHRLVAVTGPSGAGKTTLVDLLVGLLAPTAGTVEVDGEPLDGADRRRWRRSVAYVPQDAHLVHDTIRANLLRAQPQAPEAELWRVLNLAAADFVAALPDGLDTVVGDRGARLSGGERVRIVLARALLRRPALLVLDQVTGQLDAAAEQRVAAGLRSLRGETTIVAATHRPALLAAADRVVVLEAGRVVAAGAPHEVAARRAVDGDGEQVAVAGDGGPAAGDGDAVVPAVAGDAMLPAGDGAAARLAIDGAAARPAVDEPAARLAVDGSTVDGDAARAVGDGMKATRRRTVAGRPWLAGLLVALVVGAGHAAQAQTGDDFRSQATMRAGPLFLRPGFRLERLGYESNLFYQPDPQPDFVIAMAPQVDAWLPLRGRARVSATVISGADWYVEHAGERSFNPELRYRVDLPWRRFSFSAGAGRLRTRRRPDFEIDVRSNRFARDLHAGVSAQLLSRLSLNVEARQSVIGFDADAIFEGTYLSETLNRRERGAVAALRWQRTALTTFVLESEVRSARFFRSPDRNNDNVIVTAGADFHPRALVAGSGRIGVRRFQARGRAVEDISRIVADAELSFQLSGNTALTFDAARNINYSFERASPYYVVNRYGVAVTRLLGGQADLSGRVTRDLYDYQRARRGRDVRWNVFGQLGYRLNPRIRTGFEAGWVKADSTTRPRRRYSGIVLGMIFDYDL